MSIFSLSGTNAPVSQILTSWIARITDLIYRQTGVKPTVRHSSATYQEQHIAALWWRCDAAASATVFIGAADSSWRALANLLGNSADTDEDGDARRTYLKSLDASFDSTGTQIDREPQAKHREIVEIRLPEFEPIRLQFVAEPKSAPPQSAFSLLLDIELPITIRFGTSQMLLRDLLSVQPSSTIEFERHVNDPVEILVNGRTVARGEAVTVRGNYGVRIVEIANRLDRLETSAAAKPQDLSDANRGD